MPNCICSEISQSEYPSISMRTGHKKKIVIYMSDMYKWQNSNRARLEILLPHLVNLSVRSFVVLADVCLWGSVVSS